MNINIKNSDREILEAIAKKLGVMGENGCIHEYEGKFVECVAYPPMRYTCRKCGHYYIED